MTLSGKNSENTFQIQEIMGRAHNYNRWIYDQIEPFLGQRVMDVGSGFGNITRYFLGRELVISIDVEERYVERLNGDLGQSSEYEALLFDLEKDDLARLREKELDTVTCLNLIEHIEDDVGFLSRIREVLVPGGRVVLLAPALQMIYGSMDRADRHFRRYDRRSMRALLTGAGFEVDRMRYMNFPGVFGWWLNGRILKREIIPVDQLATYEKIIPFVRKLESIVPPPIGQSLVVAGLKR